MEGNFGYTGSETFAAGHRFGFFPAVGMGYYISNESFYPEKLKAYISKLKLRASIGRTGNDNTGASRFLYRPTYSTSASGFNQGMNSGGGSNGLGAGITEGRFANDQLSWEIEDKQNYGVDLGFFGNKIEIIADYFNSNRSDILLQRRTVPSSAGFQQDPWNNYGKVNNKGIDGSIDARHHIGAVKVNLRGTFTFARNKILEYDELPQPYPWMTVTGTRVSENTLYFAERLYTDDDFIITPNTNGTNSYKLKPELPQVALQGLIGPGDIKYKDLNEDGKIDVFDKQRGVGNPYNPEISYGFGINLEYKGFYISSFFQGTGNTSVLLGNGNSTFFPFNWYYTKSNYRTFMVDRWTSENPSQDVVMPRLHDGYPKNVNKEPSTWWLRDGSFLRFKNLEVGYNIPKEFLKKIKLETARVYALGYNLHVWDKIKYWDPETGNNNAGMAYPLPRTITFGVELTF
jgi:TonB-linked SusC/RagA family outer membrane protein